MANYTLTASPLDSLVGAAGEPDVFLVGAAGRLVATDTVQGGGGNVTDTLRITVGQSLTIAAFAGVRDIERLQFTALTGVSAVLADAMVASTSRPDFQVLGGVGDDTVLGGAVLAQALLIDGGAGNDWIEGGGGHDVLRAGTGADTLRGGAGNDTIEIAVSELAANDRLDGGAGRDVLRLLDGGLVTTAMFGALQGFERIEAAVAGAALRLSINAAYSIGGEVLTIEGSAADDTLSGQNASLAVYLLGGAGDDLLTGSTLGDTLAGGLGHDTLRGLDGADVLNGAEGDDRLSGGAGNDWLIGGAGNDVLSGGAGTDTLDLGSGTDRADGGAGNDLYRVLVGDFTSSDLIADEAGSADTLEFLGSGAQAIFLIGALAGRVRGIERFIFADGNDAFLPTNIIGDSAGADVVTVEGGAGNDLMNVSGVARLTSPLAFLLRGGDGNDSLIGGHGADTLEGGAGNNLIEGGNGNDLVLVESEGFSALSVINGGLGTDELRFLGDAAITAAALANVSGIEILRVADGGQAIVVPDSLFEGVGFTAVTIHGGDGDDAIDTSAFAANRRVTVQLGDGDDTLRGGAGNDSVFVGAGIDDIQVGAGVNRVTFGVGELNALDTVHASTTTAFDTLVVGVGAGRTLQSTAFAGVTGFDVFHLEGEAGSAARLPSNLVTQSGQSTIAVNATGAGMVVDGRALSQAFRLNGSNGVDILFGGSGADTLVGNGGDDTLVGGPGGDRIFLGGTADRNVALLRSPSDGTVDINGVLSFAQLAQADTVEGTQFDDNFIMVDSPSFGLQGTTTFFIGNGQNISLGNSANVLPTEYQIAGNAFGSLTAVRNAVGARLTNNDSLEFEKSIMVIGGADNNAFGVYYFEDRDHNTTVDSTDILRLLAIGTGDVPTFGSNTGFRLTDFDLV